MSEFALGLRLDLEESAKAAWGDNRPLFSTSVFDADDKPLPESFTLAQWCLWWFNQGNVGSCATNALTGSVQVANTAAYMDGEDFEVVQLSRHFVYYNGRVKDGLIGRGDGASCTNQMRAAVETGMCRETSAPYKPDARWLDRKPSAAAYEEAKGCKLTGMIEIPPDDIERRKRSIFNGHPVYRGMAWPSGWSDQGLIDKFGRTRGTGREVGGHALYDIGWCMWDGKLHWHRVNSHGLIYPIPPKEIRDSIIGYKCAGLDARTNPVERCYSFWVRHDHDLAQQGRWQETLSMTGMTGFRLKNPLTWARSMS